MSPQAKLKELAQTRELLRERIRRHRGQCVAAAGGLAVPLALLDRGLAIWRTISPLAKIAAVPFAWFLQRKMASSHSASGSLARWALARFVR